METPKKRRRGGLILIILIALLVVMILNRRGDDVPIDDTAINPTPSQSLVSTSTPEDAGTPDTAASRPQNNFKLGAGERAFTISVDGMERKYLLYVPEAYRKEIAAPLVLFYHGGGGTMEQASNDYGWKEKADKEGFIIAFTHGTSANRLNILATWNAGLCCGFARDNNIDDISYTRAVIKDIASKFNVRNSAIFGSGFSNGAMLMHRFACEAPEIFTAIAAVSGTVNVKSCEPTQQVPIMHIHATDDTHVLFNGGAGEGSFPDPKQVTDFTSVPDTLALWTDLYDLSPTPKRVYNNEGAYCDLYSGSGAGSFTLCVTPDGKHTWPGAPKPSHAGSIPTKTMDGNDVVWDFFARYMER